MARINGYVQASTPLSGDEQLVIVSPDGTKTFTGRTDDIAALSVETAASGQFYSDKGAKVRRTGDRFFVGAATDNLAQQNRTAGTNDWLSRLMSTTSIGAWPVWGAQMAALTRFGSIGLLGASHTNPASGNEGTLGYVPSSIGVAAWGVADDTANPTSATAYAFYGEGWRMPGVNYQPTFCMELEAVNLGGAASGQSTPFHPNAGGGTYGIQIGAGGGQTSGTSDAEAGIVFVNNPSAFKTGIIFSATALTGTNGSDSGFATAVAMSRNHGIIWSTPETVENVQGANSGAMIYSTVSTAALGARIQFLDSVVAFSNASGTPIFTIGTNQNPNNTLQVQAGSGQQAAGIYVQEGPSGSPNLGLYPADGGELQIASPTVAGGSSLTNNPVPDQWMHINVNGQDLRIPLFTPAQAGG